MRRVGYDADTGRYYFRDRDGTLWAGEPGAQFGEMKRGAYEDFIVRGFSGLTSFRISSWQWRTQRT